MTESICVAIICAVYLVAFIISDIREKQRHKKQIDYIYRLIHSINPDVPPPTATEQLKTIKRGRSYIPSRDKIAAMEGKIVDMYD